MKLKKIKASSVNKILKASVHKSGKLGFTKDAADFLNLDNGKSVSILMNEEDGEDKNLYVQVNATKEDRDDFKVSRAGDYFYVNLKYFYDNQNENYIEDSIRYKISKIDIEGEEYYVFNRLNELDEDKDDEDEQ